jgi:hypothetical protein
MLIEQHPVQAAILDVNLIDRDVTPVTELLIEGGVPPVQRLARRWQPPTDEGHYCHGRRDHCRRRRRWVKAGRKKAPARAGQDGLREEKRVRLIGHALNGNSRVSAPLQEGLWKLLIFSGRTSSFGIVRSSSSRRRREAHYVRC